MTRAARDRPRDPNPEAAMGHGTQQWRGQAGAVAKAAATLVLIGLLAAAGERSLAPLMIERPDDRSPADVRATDAVYRYAASYATWHETADEPPNPF